MKTKNEPQPRLLLTTMNNHATIRPIIPLRPALVLSLIFLALSAGPTLRTQAACLVAWGAGAAANCPAATSNAVALATGAGHALALLGEGTVVAWGDNGSYQTNVPVTLSNVVAVAAGLHHSLALRANGTVAAWGGNYHGQSSVPVGLSNVVAIAAGGGHSVALRSDGTVTNWGRYTDGTINFVSNPFPASFSNIIAIATGEEHDLLLKSDGTVLAWGWNPNGQTDVPPELTNAVSIAAGTTDSLAVTADGKVLSWGTHQGNEPVGLSNVVRIAAGLDHKLALKANGTVVAWGGNASGQTSVPPGLTGVAAIGAGQGFSLALADAGPPPVMVVGSSPHYSHGVFSVTMPSRRGRMYRLECRDSLGQGNWRLLLQSPGNGGSQTLEDSSASGKQRFYRVKQW
jgi:hypothetical protein